MILENDSSLTTVRIKVPSYETILAQLYSQKVPLFKFGKRQKLTLSLINIRKFEANEFPILMVIDSATFLWIFWEQSIF